jgi:rod shape-determining protein MreC
VHDKQVRRRRAVLALLVGVSLILLTAYFGESPSSPLHSVQRGIVQVLSPIQKGASTALKPVRDIAGWFSSTFHAKAERDRLRGEVNKLLAENSNLKQALIENQQLRQQVGLDNSNSISSYKPVAAHVISRDPTLWYATIQVDKGSDDGVHVDDPVTGDGALVGKVSLVAPSVSVVTLITDHSFAVSAEVQDQYGDTGVLVPKVGDPSSLLLQYLPPHAPISSFQRVVTAGFTTPGGLDSLYPPGIPIGQVNTNFSQNDLLNNRQVQVTPFADLRHLDFVQILTHVNAGTQRAQVP